MRIVKPNVFLESVSPQNALPIKSSSDFQFYLLLSNTHITNINNQIAAVNERWKNGGYASKKEYEYWLKANEDLLIGQFDARDIMSLSLTTGELTNDIFGLDVCACNDSKIICTNNSMKDGDRTNPDIKNNAFGNFIIAQQKDGYMAYAHLKQNSITVRPGDMVIKGQKIAEVGDTGNSDGPHLHFGLYEANPIKKVGGKYVVDPYVKGKILDNFEPYESAELPHMQVKTNNTGRLNQHELI